MVYGNLSSKNILRNDFHEINIVKHFFDISLYNSKIRFYMKKLDC